MPELNDKIKRINELYHKSKNEGLTEQEKAEQQKLRDEYRNSFRGDFVSQLKTISIVNEDGTVTELGKKNV